MKAVRVTQFGGPEVLRVEEIPAPRPGPGEALVKLAAIGINFMDVQQRLGRYPAMLPFIPGAEGAGVVEALGPRVTEVETGERVTYAMAPGSYAEYAVVPVGKLVRMPDQMDFRMAAAVMLQGMTAHYLTHSTYPVKEGDTCLVHDAVGGVGGLLVQMAKLQGARVIGTASSPQKVDRALSLGADEVIRYSDQDFEDEVRRLTEGRGVEVVYDGVGKATFEKDLYCLAPRGYLVLFGQSSGPVSTLDTQILGVRGSLYLTRPSLDHYTLTREELLWRAGHVLGWVAAGQIRINIGGEFPLDSAAEAHRRLESRQSMGKLLLIP